MTRVPTRTHFFSSSLIRVLSDLAILEAVEPSAGFSEKLGLWVDYSDAIALSIALNAGSPNLSGTRDAAHSLGGDVASEDLARLRASLENLILQRGLITTGKTLVEWPSPDFKLPVKVAAAYEPYRKYYAAYQRRMDADIRPLRVSVRAALAKTSPSLKQLATLDAALDKILCERESQLLSTVPLLLRKRFEHLLKAHQKTLFDTQQADKPGDWMKQGAWLSRFCNELQTVLLAELDVRLQPTVGLIEALHNGKK